MSITVLLFAFVWNFFFVLFPHNLYFLLLTLITEQKEIKSFLRSNMYDNKSVLRKNQRGKKIIKKLFKIIQSSPKKFLTKEQLTKDKYRAISDFISGMTDRFAINIYKSLKWIYLKNIKIV